MGGLFGDSPGSALAGTGIQAIHQYSSFFAVFKNCTDRSFLCNARTYTPGQKNSKLQIFLFIQLSTLV